MLLIFITSNDTTVINPQIHTPLIPVSSLIKDVDEAIEFQQHKACDLIQTGFDADFHHD